MGKDFRFTSFHPRLCSHSNQHCPQGPDLSLNEFPVGLDERYVLPHHPIAHLDHSPGHCLDHPGSDIEVSLSRHLDD